MPEILHRITIEAPPRDVYRALTTLQGLKSWWTSDVSGAPEAGAMLAFGFNHHSVVFRMNVLKLVRYRLVAWSCEGEVDEWTGTTVRFELQSVTPIRTTLDFTHAAWRSTHGAYRQCNTDWGRLMYYLKEAVEGTGSGPMMS